MNLFVCWRALVVAGVLMVGALGVRAAEPAAGEAISFAIEKMPLNQQGPQVVDLDVRLTYAAGIGPKDYPDFEGVYKKLVGWMNAYPTKTDYWEVFNKQLCKNVLKDYPMLAEVTLDLTVHPTFGVPYRQTIHTTLTR